MNTFSKASGYFASLTAVLCGALTAGCNSGSSAAAPTVTAVAPANHATLVVMDNTVISATFSEPVATLGGGAAFTVTCAAPCVNPTGTVALNSTSSVATFTLAPTTTLAPLALYTVTVSGASSLATGAVLATPFVWQFTTTAKPSSTLPPAVTAVAPVENATGVAINELVISAEFSVPIAAFGGGATFTLSCAAPCVSPAGSLGLDATQSIALYSLPSATTLAPLTLYTATVTGAEGLGNGIAMTVPFVWQFKTGAAADTTRPRVAVTQPVTTNPGPTLAVPSNAAITAAFTQDMSPATMTAANFGLTCAAPCVSPAGAVTYNVGSRTAVLTPEAALVVGATYTATITTHATDLAGNALAGDPAALPSASNYVWSFTTSAPGPAANISVLSTKPTADEQSVCPGAAINATLRVPSGLRLDATTVNSATFTVTGPAPELAAVVAASVVLDAATGTIATLTPHGPLVEGETYTATIMGGADGVRDLAIPANEMLSNFKWEFTAGAATADCVAPIILASIAASGTFGGTAGMTNSGILTVVNGDIGTIATAPSSITGFHDTAGDVYTESPSDVGAVNGTIFTCTHSTTGPNAGAENAANCKIATQARLDAQSAYLQLQGLPPGANPGGNLAKLTLAPGVYTAPAGSFLIQGGDLTLDAMGDANAVWVFQMATTLTVGGPGAAAPQSIVLAGGAQAKNVYWQVGTAATINAGGGGTMVGTIIAGAGATFSTARNTAIVTLNGRALSLGASVTLVDTVINVPAP
jgi:Ice-binding-like/Bacterial Ig-like domain